MATTDLLAELGVPAEYGVSPPLPRYVEARELDSVGPNIVGREQRLAPRTARDWRAMRDAALEDGVELMLVSGFRSVAEQAALIRGKLEVGQSIDVILRVNAAPGFSQHHTGRAVDIATRGSRPLTEDFDNTQAFAWLTENAAQFGFTMPYPPDNQYGLAYEPWHWSQLAASLNPLSDQL